MITRSIFPYYTSQSKSPPFSASKKNDRNFELFKSFPSFLIVEVKERILLIAKELFFKYGIRSVTLDEMARELGISKKTIYQHFKDKNHIVHEVIMFFLQKDREYSEAIYKSAKDPIHEVIETTVCIRENVSNVHTSLFYDIQKYHPKAWNLYLEQRQFYYEIIRRNLKEGIEQGYYREDINPDILALLRLASIELGFGSDSFTKKNFDFMEIQAQTIDHFIRGVVTEKGKQLYTEYLNLK